MLARAATRPCAACCRERETGTLGRVGGKSRRPLVGRQGRDVAATSQRPGADELKGDDQLRVGAVGGEGAMPGLAVGFPEPASASARARWARRRSSPVAAW